MGSTRDQCQRINLLCHNSAPAEHAQDRTKSQFEGAVLRDVCKTLECIQKQLCKVSPRETEGGDISSGEYTFYRIFGYVYSRAWDPHTCACVSCCFRYVYSHGWGMRVCPGDHVCFWRLEMSCSIAPHLM